jgi:hypothetical protein
MLPYRELEFPWDSADRFLGLESGLPSLGKPLEGSKPLPGQMHKGPNVTVQFKVPTKC